MTRYQIFRRRKRTTRWYKFGKTINCSVFGIDALVQIANETPRHGYEYKRERA